MYKIIFSDLDETLLVNHHVPDFNIKAIKEARNKGVKFVPCTGRAFNMIDTILEELDAKDKEDEYSVCFNGGLIVENKNNKILHFKGISYELCKKVFDYGKHLDVCVMVFTVDCCYLFHASEDEVARKIQQKAKFKICEEYDMSFLKEDKIAKILYQRADMDFLTNIVDNLPKELADDLNIGYSSNRYIEFNAPGIHKGYGIEWLCNYLNIPVEASIGIGDNYNDVDLIKTASLGVAVACANDDIKELAQYVTTKDYDEGAVQEVIEKYILEEE